MNSFGMAPPTTLFQHAVAVLAVAAGLADELGVGRGRVEDGFAVGDFGLAGVGFDLELADQTVHDDLEVKFAHAGDDGLAGFGVAVDREGRVFVGERGERGKEFVAGRGALGLDCNGDHGVGERHGLEDDLVPFVADGVAGGAVLEADAGGDVAAVDHVAFLTGIGVHLEQTSETFAAAGSGIDDRCAFFRHAGIDADERELADVRVVHDLEDQRGKRLIVAAVTGDGRFGIRVGAFGLPDIDRGRQIIDDCVEEELDALVLEGSLSGVLPSR